MRAFHFVLAAALAVGCGPGKRNGNTNCFGVCTALGYEQCHEDGTLDPPVACADGQTCDPQSGCVTCPPDELYCDGNDVKQCNSAGTGGTLVMTCPADQACSAGACKTPCEAAEDNPSNLGCDFWAVDLDNEAFNLIGASNDAAAQQFAVVAANNNDVAVTVTVSKNTGRVGAALAEVAVLQKEVPPHTAIELDLPQREVDGGMGQNGTYTQNSGSGTFVSPHAYHVVATGPVVVYQFNPITQAFSNDASTLIPKQALGTDYVVVGFDTANPCGQSQIPIASIPDHASVTIIPQEDNTTVTVTTTHPIMASGGDSGIMIAETPKNGTVTLTLSRYTVANLESRQVVGSIGECTSAISNGQTGDFTGTTVHSDKPIAVFTSHERGDGFGGATNIVNPPGWDTNNGDDLCCTDHLEEQLFPVTALGKQFAIARSPIRSTDPSWTEPDIERVVATVDGTVITTNLPAPYNTFTLDKNKQKTFGSTTGFTISASQPVEVATYLVPQHFVKQGYIGDPSQLLMPAAEQFRKDYVFLIPQSFDSNFIVVAKPSDAVVTLDGTVLASVEQGCATGPIGMIGGTLYDQITCAATKGHHAISADKPFGLSVYGYHNVSSYAFVGGSDVKIINPIGKYRAR